MVVAIAALLGLVAGAAVRHFAYFPLRVTSNSMFPSVAAGDWVVIYPQLAVNATPVHRGDIVLFRFPFGGSGRAIKRVVAVEGDQVTADQNEIRVNGDIVNFGWNKSKLDATPIGSTVETTVIPAGYYYILGDNVTSSVDSRLLGLLPQTEVLGKVTAIVKEPW